MVPMAVGLGWTFVPFTLIATTNVVDEEAGLASGNFNTSQQIGGALGLAILSTVANDIQQARLEELGRKPAPADFLAAAVDGFQTAFFAAPACCCSGCWRTLSSSRAATSPTSM